MPDAIRRADVLALPLAEAMRARGWLAGLSAAELVFALMPLRHSATEERLEGVLMATGARSKEADDAANLLRRFRKHTELRLAHLRGDGDPDDILERPDEEHRLPQDGALDVELAKTIGAFVERLERAGALSRSEPSDAEWWRDFGDDYSGARERDE